MAAAITYTAARARFASLCDSATSSREPIIIHRRGAEDVALISAAELRSILETAHLLRSPENAKRLLKALRRARRRSLQPRSLDRLRSALRLQTGKR
ncbi:MAG: type II toxin-antitoxin system Phd/YefM family antitoxin [Thermoanaerobaculia bacterium]